MRVVPNQLLSTIPMDDEFFSLKQVEDIQSMLGDMAQKPRTTFTKKQTIEAVIDDIERALETRSFQEVAEGLTEKGVEVSVAALRQYVSRYRRSQKKKVGKKRKSAGQQKAAAGKKHAATKDVKTAKAKASENQSIGSGQGRFIDMPEDL